MMPHAPQPGPGAAAPTAVLRDLRTMIEQIGPPTDSDSSGLPPCVGGEDPRWELTPGVVARWCLGPETEDGLLPPWPPAGAAAPAAVSPVMPVAAQQPERAEDMSGRVSHLLRAICSRSADCRYEELRQLEGSSAYAELICWAQIQWCQQYRVDESDSM